MTIVDEARPGADASEVLRVDDLKVHFTSAAINGRKRTVYAVDGVSFTVRENEALGIIG